MNPSQGGVTRILAIILIIAFVLSAAFSIAGYNFVRTFLSASTYKNALTSQDFYTRLPGAITGQILALIEYDPCKLNPLLCPTVNQLVLDCARSALGNGRFAVLTTPDGRPVQEEMQKLQACAAQYQPNLQSAAEASQAPLLFRSINAADLEKIIAAGMPPEQLQAQSENIIDGIFAYLNGLQPDIRFSLAPLKQSLQDPGAMQAVLEIIRSQPQCSLGILEQMLMVTLTGQGDLQFCNPSDSLLTALAPTIQSQFDAVVSLLPDKVAFSPFGSLPAEAVRTLRLLLLLSPELPLFFLILLTLLTVRTFREMLYWWGIPLFSAGVLTLIAGVVTSPILTSAWQKGVVGHLSLRISNGVVDLIDGVYQVVLQSYQTGVFITGIILILVGGAMLAGPRLLRLARGEPVEA